MVLALRDKKIFLASEPVDFRMSIDGLSRLVQLNNKSYIHDGSIYVFYNRNKDKIKCLFWDKNGFVLYYKRLDNCKFKFKKMTQAMNDITPQELDIILSGYDPNQVKRLPQTIEG